jgi:hypothetical protein
MNIHPSITISIITQRAVFLPCPSLRWERNGYNYNSRTALNKQKRKEITLTVNCNSALKACTLQTDTAQFHVWTGKTRTITNTATAFRAQNGIGAPKGGLWMFISKLIEVSMYIIELQARLSTCPSVLSFSHKYCGYSNYPSLWCWILKIYSRTANKEIKSFPRITLKMITILGYFAV